MNNNTPTISTNLKMAAFGITLAFIPCALLLFLYSVDIVSMINNDTVKVLVGAQFIGVIIAALSLITCNNNATKLGIPSAAFTLCAIGLILTGVYELITTFAPGVFSDLNYFDDKIKAVVVNVVIYAIMYLPLAIGTLLAAKRLPALRLASTIFFISVVVPVINYLFLKTLIDDNSYWYTDLHKYMIASFGLSLLLSIICTVAWWKACGNASQLEEEYQENGDMNDTTVYVEPTPAATSQTSTATPPPFNGNNNTAAGNNNTNTAYSNLAPQTAANGTPITEEQKRLLMGMSDDELTKVINNPMLYANPAFVEEARTTLLKRQAWEMIKDYTDAQLLDIVHNNPQGFAYEVLDASSMELLARETEEFVNEIKALSTEQLQGIVSNPGSYFDGYVRLAQSTLAERLNPAAPSQSANN